MTPTPEQIAEVQRTFPAWDEWTVRRHLQQRAAIVAQTPKLWPFPTYMGQALPKHPAVRPADLPEARF